MRLFPSGLHHALAASTKRKPILFEAGPIGMYACRIAFGQEKYQLAFVPSRVIVSSSRNCTGIRDRFSRLHNESSLLWHRSYLVMSVNPALIIAVLNVFSSYMNTWPQSLIKLFITNTSLSSEASLTKVRLAHAVYSRCSQDLSTR